MRLESAISVVKGVGPILAEKLLALGVKTVGDMLYFFPRRYDDFSQVTPIAQLKPGKVTIEAKVESVTGRYVRSRLHITEAVLSDGTAKLRAVWFNQPYRATQLAKDATYFFSGTYDLQRNRYVLNNPAAEQASSFGVSTARIVPIYPETKGLKSQQLRKILRELLPLMGALPETLPSPLVKKYNLLGINSTLGNLHFPESADQLQQAKRRIAFEELLWLMLASALTKHETASQKGWHVPFDQNLAKAFTAALPFTMTGAQKRAAWEMLQDFHRAKPMNRLLQGDVGSGKTIVAGMLAFMAAKAGLQTAFLAPTEILARQHATTLAQLLEPFRQPVALLVGSTQNKEDIKRHLASGDIAVVVGTHALLQGDSVFQKLGLVIIDEQHRFGVRQRAELLTKSKHMPHLLSMTATPIPRSLQLTVYGELEVSILDELPKGRQPIVTKVVATSARHNVYTAVEAELKKGRQAYIVCPVIAEGAHPELKSAQSEYDRLQKTIFKHRRIGLLHGQLKANEKDQVMRAFKKGDFDLLVATTVVEVGVDVPNATTMIIEGADRFGLAQLHQLRGRVGRGSEQSYCFLIPANSQTVSRRLRELEQSTDGFYLAEVDLKLRGPGEVYGRAQHGKLDLSFVNLADTKLIKEVQTAANWCAAHWEDLLQYKQLTAKVQQYQGLTRLN